MQVSCIQRELQQLRDLQSSAVSSLGDSFLGLESQSREQENLVTSLLDRVAQQTTDESQSSHLMAEVGNLVRMFVDSIKAMADGSMGLVAAMNEMQQQIIFGTISLQLLPCKCHISDITLSNSTSKALQSIQKFDIHSDLRPLPSVIRLFPIE